MAYSGISFNLSTSSSGLSLSATSNSVFQDRAIRTSASSISSSVGSTAQVRGYTPVSKSYPLNTSWSTADVTFDIKFSTTNANVNLQCRLNRVNSSDTVVENGTYTADQTCAADRTFTITQPTWSSPAATDYLQLELSFTRVGHSGTEAYGYYTDRSTFVYPVVPATGSAYTVEQKDFRVRNDDGSETTATWRQAINTNDTVSTGTNYRLRFNMQVDSLGSGPNDATMEIAFQYNKNATGWHDITGSSSVIRAVSSSNYADYDSTTQQLGGGTFKSGQGMTEYLSDDPNAIMDPGLTWTVNDEFEIEFCFQVVDADVSNSDTIQIRCVSPLYMEGTGTWDPATAPARTYATAASGTALMRWVHYVGTYTQTPTLTVSKAAATRRVFITFIN